MVISPPPSRFTASRTTGSASVAVTTGASALPTRARRLQDLPGLQCTEALALASDKVKLALEGRPVKKVIHAGGRLINIVG